MRQRRHHILFAGALGLILLIAVAAAGGFNALSVTIFVTSTAASVALQRIFRRTKLFAVTFASLAAVYAAIFQLFVEAFFAGVRPFALSCGFALPITLFVMGCWLRRAAIRRIFRAISVRPTLTLRNALAWMLPVFLVGFSIFVLSDVTPIEVNTTSIFLGAMLLIGAIVFFVSEQVALFLVDIGLLFDEFLGRIAGLAVPAFAFLTFYAFLVIFFGAIYSILSQHSATPHFHVNGVDRPITFLEAIYFSVVTISTVGYGDVVPASNVMRVLASLQVICGVLLLLFGVSELLEYTREHRGGKDGSGGVK